MTTSSQLQLRRGTATQVAAFTGAVGELTPDLTNNRLVLHDGSTAGGHPQASEAMVTAAIAAAVADAGVSSLNGQTGALVFITPPQGRLCLQSGEAVPAVSRSAKTTIFYTPYVGNQLPLYDRTNMIPTAFSELSVATTDTTKNPAAIGANKVNDWFVWDDSGTLRLSHGPDWTNDTTRSTGTTLVNVNGIYLNNAAITNGPAALRGTYVGTTRSDASSHLNWTFGAGASGGSAAFFGVWNMYNRVNVTTSVIDNGASYTYSAGVRQARGSAGNQVQFVSGLAEDGVSCSYSTRVATVAVASAFIRTGVGVDSISAITGQGGLVFNGSSVATNTTPCAAAAPGAFIGFHTIAAVEGGDGTNLNTLNADMFGTLTFAGRM